MNNEINYRSRDGVMEEIMRYDMGIGNEWYDLDARSWGQAVAQARSHVYAGGFSGYSVPVTIRALNHQGVVVRCETIEIFLSNEN